MNVQFGYVGSLFGVISSSALSVYDLLVKKLSKYEVVLADYGDSSVPDCDVVVVNGIHTYLACKNYFHSNMCVVVCGGPLQVDTLEGVHPLDYEKSASYMFNLIPIDPKKIIRSFSKNTPPLKVKTLKIDHLAMVVDNTASGGVALTEYNKLISTLNFPARNAIKTALADVFLHRMTLKDFSIFMKSLEYLKKGEIRKRRDDLLEKIESKEFHHLISNVLSTLPDSCFEGGKRPTKIQQVSSVLKANQKIEPFEFNFFRNMVKGICKNDTRHLHLAKGKTKLEGIRNREVHGR